MFLVCAWIAWCIVADTSAKSLSVSAPATALIWSSDASAALDELAQKELRSKDGDLNAAQEWARRALRSDPLDDLALFLLGIVAERKGDAARADDLMRIAGKRTWRNLGTQLWLFERDVKRKDFAAALPHADAMFRVEPKLMQPIFPTLAAFTTDPGGLRALADFLATDPPWREWMLGSLSSQLYDKSHLDQLYSMLLASKSPPTTRELSSYLNRLIKNGRYELAYQTWRASLKPPPPADHFPYNGNFEIPLDGLPFNWTSRPVRGADVKIVTVDDAKGRALRAQFSGARVQFDVRQLMLLPPGQYRLTGRVKTQNLQTSRGLWWHVSCLTGRKASLGHSDLVSGSMPWSSFHLDFEIPPQGCDTQSLRLELPARIAPEHQIEGQVWYQDIRISPRPPE